MVVRNADQGEPDGGFAETGAGETPAPHGGRPDARARWSAAISWSVRANQGPRAAEIWVVGTFVLWRGQMTEVRVATTTMSPWVDADRVAWPKVCLAADVFRVANLEGDLRPTLEAHFARRARIELPARTWELAAVTGVDVKLVTVRNQRSRWGSCSASGTISLNWRLVQTPDFVRDYIIYHELMHLREMNHSERFWARVAEVCPGWRDAERWIKRNGALVGL